MMRTKLAGLLVAMALLAAACGRDEVVVSSGESASTSLASTSSSALSASTSTASTASIADSPTSTVRVPGQSNADSPEQRRIEEAAFFRLNLVNQTGQQHLSLTDYALIRGDACNGAVDDPAALVALSRRWGLGSFSTDEAVAGVIWLAARNTCPEVFDEQALAQGPPYIGSDGGASPPESGGEEPDAAQMSFVDLSVLDEPTLQWSGEQLLMFSASSLSAEDTVDHFREAFSEGWAVNEVLGPVTDISGLTFWSLDVSGNGFSGVVEVYETGPEVSVFIAVIDGPYPLADFVVDTNPAVDGELDCLTDITWTQSGSVASGVETEAEVIDAFVARYRGRYGLDDFAVVRDRVVSLLEDGREVMVGSVSPVSGGYAMTTISACEPYRP